MKLTIKKREGLFCGLILLVSILLDQITKHLAVLYLKPVGTVGLWEGVFHLTYCTNTGAAFSIFSAPDQRWIFLTVSTVAIIFMLVYLVIGNNLSSLTRYSLAAIAGGGIGNMIDRLTTGAVVDFFDFRLINFAVFNVADCFVTVGGCFLVLALFLEWQKEVKAEKAAKEAGLADKAPTAEEPAGKTPSVEETGANEEPADTKTAETASEEEERA